MTAALKAVPGKLVLLFDEFDEPFASIHFRAFSTCARAFKDRHSERLVYVTATVLPLTNCARRTTPASSPELFSYRTWYLAADAPDQERFIQRYMDALDVYFGRRADVDLTSPTGGHPRCSTASAARCPRRWHRTTHGRDSTRSIGVTFTVSGPAAAQRRDLCGLSATRFGPVAAKSSRRSCWPFRADHAPQSAVLRRWSAVTSCCRWTARTGPLPGSSASSSSAWSSKSNPAAVTGRCGQRRGHRRR
ncbi:MAG: hypothetical protein R2838_20450 [Caldilineaceae bacterium]